MSKWMYVYQARLALAEWHIKHTESDYLRAMRTANDQIMDALALSDDRALPSRSTKFVLTFESPNESRSWDLEEGGWIPQLFWQHWNDAYKEQVQRQVLATINSESFAKADFECFEFRLTGMKDGGVMYGRAEGVEVRRDSLPGNMPRPRGRIPGSGKNDDAAVDWAEAMLEAGNRWNEVIPKAAAMMEGASPEACRARLRKRLKERGIFPPKKIPRPEIRDFK